MAVVAAASREFAALTLRACGDVTCCFFCLYCARFNRSRALGARSQFANFRARAGTFLHRKVLDATPFRFPSRSIRRRDVAAGPGPDRVDRRQRLHHVSVCSPTARGRAGRCRDRISAVITPGVAAPAPVASICANVRTSPCSMPSHDWHYRCSPCDPFVLSSAHFQRSSDSRTTKRSRARARTRRRPPDLRSK